MHTVAFDAYDVRQDDGEYKNKWRVGLYNVAVIIEDAKTTETPFKVMKPAVYTSSAKFIAVHKVTQR